MEVPGSTKIETAAQSKLGEEVERQRVQGIQVSVLLGETGIARHGRARRNT